MGDEGRLPPFRGTKEGEYGRVDNAVADMI